MTGKIGCPACGAPVDAKAERCPYCQQLYPAEVIEARRAARYGLPRSSERPPRGIPSDLHQPLRKTLLQCPHFADVRQLRAFFADSALAPWRNRLPTADNPGVQVSLTISYLVDIYNTKGENALVLLLRLLAGTYEEGDELRERLLGFAEELEAVKCVERDSQ